MSPSIKTPPELEELSEQIGNFIEYWGFKRIHGRIWTQLYLSRQPLSAGELIRRLKVSKALISMSLTDLLEYEVVREVGKGERGTLLYEANPDLMGVIMNVLRTRERRMISRILVAHKHLKALKAGDRQAFSIDDERLERMGELIQTADEVLESAISMGEQNLDISGLYEAAFEKPGDDRRPEKEKA